MKQRVLLVVPDERKVYEHISIKVGAFHLPSLACAVLAAVAKQAGHTVDIIDLSLCGEWSGALEQRMAAFKPDYVGLTGTTAIYFHMMEIGRYVHEHHPGTGVLAGGPHVSATVSESLNSGCFDYIFVGEAERSFPALLDGKDPEAIGGMAFINSRGDVVNNPSGGFLKDLDDYPLPDYSLFDLSRYPVASIHAKQNPVVWIETSRGCPFDCKICNKVVHGQTFRPKSPQRVLDEMEHFAKMGVREFHIADDGFTSNLKRATEISEGLIERNLGVTWSCTNGIRVDRVTQDLLNKMRRAGCYRISFGIESGNQVVLDRLGKRITLEQVSDAVRMARKARIEVFGFFMFGFMDDTVQTMRDTIAFARKLPMDLAKASLIMPFPGAPLHREYAELDLLYPPEDYRKYNVYVSPRDVYRHPTLDWDTIEAHQKAFYRNVYFNPAFVFRRLWREVRNGTLLQSVRAALSVKWF